jgi:hypothetical protein
MAINSRWGKKSGEKGLNDLTDRLSVVNNRLTRTWNI